MALPSTARRNVFLYTHVEFPSMPLYLDLLCKDAVLCLRTLRKDRAFTLLSISLLAAGIGVASAVFTLLCQVLYAQLPVPHPEQILALTSSNAPTHPALPFSLPAYRYLETHPASGLRVLANANGLVNAETPAGASHSEAGFVSGNFFSELQVKPILGRNLISDDNSVMLSYDFWQSAYGGQVTAWNSTLHINGIPFRIVGVTPPGFKGLTAGHAPKLYLPLSAFVAIHPEFKAGDNWSFRFLSAFIRLPLHRSRPAIEAQLQVLFSDIVRQQFAHSPAGSAGPRNRLPREQLSLLPASHGLLTMVEKWQDPLRLLQWMTAAVLLLAAINVTGLLVVRAIKYRSEMVVRFALGATRSAVMRLQFLETLVVAVAAGLLAFVLSEWGAKALVHLARLDQYSAFSYRPQGWALAAHWLAAISVGVLTGLIPAWQSSRISLAQGLSEGSATHSTSRSQVFTRRSLAAAQIALSLILTVAAGLFALSLFKLTSVPVGFSPQHLTTFTIDAHQANATATDAHLLWSSIHRRLQTAPGVQSATYGNGGPFPQEIETTSIGLGSAPALTAMQNPVGTAFFSTLRIPVLAGREIDSRDRATSPPVVMLNQSLARRLFRSSNPIGQTVALNGETPARRLATVVGIVADYRLSWRRAGSSVLYVPAQQTDQIINMVYYVRTAGSSLDEAAVRQLVRAESPGIPPFDMASMPTRIAEFASGERAMAFLISAFASLALAIAAVGVYGVISYGASVRLNEFAVRAAIGAMPRDLTWIVMKEALAIFFAGIVLAAPLAWFIAAVLRHQLTGVSLSDTSIYPVAIALLAFVTLIAAAVPARKVARMNVYRALRHA